MEPALRCSENLTEHLDTEVQERMNPQRFADSKSKWDQLQLYAVQKGTNFAGHASGGAGMAQIQASGTRIVALCRIDQLWSELGCSSIQACLDGLQNLTPEHEAFRELTTFAYGCFLAGDILLVPQGYVCVEKAVNDHNIGFRSLSHMCFHRLHESMKIFRLHLARNYGTEIMCSVLEQAATTVWADWSQSKAKAALATLTGTDEVEEVEEGQRKALPGPTLPLDSHPDNVRAYVKMWRMDAEEGWLTKAQVFLYSHYSL